MRMEGMEKQQTFHHNVHYFLYFPLLHYTLNTFHPQYLFLDTPWLPMSMDNEICREDLKNLLEVTGLCCAHLDLFEASIPMLSQIFQ